MKILLFAIPFLLLFSNCTPENLSNEKQNPSLPSGDYFGLTADTTAQIFAEGIVSREFQELNAVFSPDGNEFYFTIADASRSFYSMIFYKKNKTGVWEGAMMAPFSGSYSDADPYFTSDGKKLYYISKRPLGNQTEERKDFDIWFVERTDSGWSDPIHLGEPINTDQNEFYVSATDDGSIFYSATYEGGLGYGDIYEAKLVDGKYVVTNLGEAINSPMGEGDPYVSPDGKMIIFMSWGRKDEIGRGDLYISFKENGVWKKAVNMGDKINSDKFEYCPMMSPDGKYFFWTSYRSSPFPTDQPRTYDQFINQVDGADNGLGNVYWIKAEVLEQFK